VSVKLKLAASIFALVAIPALAFGQQGDPPLERVIVVVIGITSFDA
jgi:hypothetical protein